MAPDFVWNQSVFFATEKDLFVISKIKEYKDGHIFDVINFKDIAIEDINFTKQCMSPFDHDRIIDTSVAPRCNSIDCNITGGARSIYTTKATTKELQDILLEELDSETLIKMAYNNGN